MVLKLKEKFLRSKEVIEIIVYDFIFCVLIYFTIDKGSMLEPVLLGASMIILNALMVWKLIDHKRNRGKRETHRIENALYFFAFLLAAIAFGSMIFFR